MRNFITLAFLTALGITAFSQTKEKSLFWEISGNGLEKPSYLYGTMHVQDQRVFNFKDGVLDALDQSETYVMEVNFDSVNQKELMGMMLMKNDTSLRDLLEENQYELVNQFFRDSLGQSLFLYSKMLPMLTAQMVDLRGMSYQQEDALDVYFAKRAKKNHLSVMGLETMDEQLQALSSIPYTNQAEMLYESVNSLYEIHSQDTLMDQLFNLYLEGDLEGMLTMSNQGFEDSTLEKMFEEHMLTNRNEIMVERMIPIIHSKRAFVAVGAAHLGGSQGIITKLRSLGYTVVAK